MKVIPSLSKNSYIYNPSEMIEEVLGNYVRGSSRQSVLFKTRSLMSDIADSNNNVTNQKQKIVESLTDLLKNFLTGVSVTTDYTDPTPIVNISWENNGKIEKITNINLNDYNTNIYNI